MSIFGFESVAVVTEFQTEFLRLIAYSRLEVRSMGVLERVGQGFLSDMEKVFLPGLWKLRHFALRLKRSVKRRAGGRVLNSTFERLPKILVLQSLRAQRVHGPARFTQALPGQFAGA